MTGDDNTASPGNNLRKAPQLGISRSQGPITAPPFLFPPARPQEVPCEFLSGLSQSESQSLQCYSLKRAFPLGGGSGAPPLSTPPSPGLVPTPQEHTNTRDSRHQTPLRAQCLPSGTGEAWLLTVPEFTYFFFFIFFLGFTTCRKKELPGKKEASKLTDWTPGASRWGWGVEGVGVQGEEPGCGPDPGSREG